MTEKIQYIPARLKNAAQGGHVAGVEDIIDDTTGKTQQTINAETDETLAAHASSISGLDGQNYITLVATDADTDIAAVFTRLSVTPAVNTIYRIANWKHDATTKYNTAYYSEYAANGTTTADLVPITVENKGIDDEPTAGSNNLVKSGGVQNELALGAVYDVSAKNPTAGPNSDGKFTLEYILDQNNVNTLIPTSVRRGGMSIKFVQSSDNKYVQYRYMGTSVANADFSNLANWKMDGTENVVSQSASSAEIRPNVFNVWGEVASLAITFAAGVQGYVNEYMFQFTCPSNAATALTLPSQIRWANDDALDPKPGYTYQVSVENNLAIYAGWEAPAQ